MAAKSAGERSTLGALGGNAVVRGLEVAGPPHAAKTSA
jgi:hypothetical protein